MGISFKHGFALTAGNNGILWNRHVSILCVYFRGHAWMRDYRNRLKHRWYKQQDVYLGRPF